MSVLFEGFVFRNMQVAVFTGDHVFYPGFGSGNATPAQGAYYPPDEHCGGEKKDNFHVGKDTKKSRFFVLL